MCRFVDQRKFEDAALWLSHIRALNYLVTPGSGIDTKALQVRAGVLSAAPNSPACACRAWCMAPTCAHVRAV